MDDYILSHYISVSWKPGWRHCKVEGDWESGGGGSKCNQSESTPACRTERVEIWQGLGGRVHFRKPSSKWSLLWNRKCSFSENRHNGDRITPARAHVLHIHTCQVLNLRLPGSEQKVRACAALPRAAGAVVFGWINAMGRIITVCRERFPFHPAHLSFHSFHWGNNCLLWEAVCFKSLYLHLDITQAAHLQSSLIFNYKNIF